MTQRPSLTPLFAAVCVAASFGAAHGCTTGGEVFDYDTGADSNVGTDTSTSPDAGPDDAGPCARWEAFRFGECVPRPASCAAGEECQNDSCCVDDECIPFGVGPCGDSDPSCEAPPVAGPFGPDLECEWTGPADTSNNTGSHNQVMASVIVGDFDFRFGPVDRAPVGGVRTVREQRQFVANHRWGDVRGAICAHEPGTLLS